MAARLTGDGVAEGGNNGRGELRSLAALGVPSLGRGGVVKGRHPDLTHIAPLDGPKGTTGQDSRSSNLTPSRRTRRARAAWLSVARGKGRSLRARMTTLGWVDYAVMLLYFAFVLGIGAAVRRYVHTSEDFFLSGRAIPAWVTGLAFVSANLGAQEVIGMGASGAKYGIATSHFYWVGAIPAMVFIGLFMMPFYYGSRARSVPEYLKLRFDEKTRALNAVSFAIMTVFSSGISLYAMGKLLNLLLGWSFDLSILVAAGVVLAYIFLGGLTSAIYNEVLQFFLIVLGFAPLVFLGLRAVGGWSGPIRAAGRSWDTRPPIPWASSGSAW